MEPFLQTQAWQWFDYIPSVFTRLGLLRKEAALWLMGRLSSADGYGKEPRLTSRRSVTACRHLTSKAFYDSAIHNCVWEIMWIYSSRCCILPPPRWRQDFTGVWWEVFGCKIFNVLALAVQTGTAGFGQALIQHQRGPEPEWSKTLRNWLWRAFPDLSWPARTFSDLKVWGKCWISYEFLIFEQVLYWICRWN